MSNVDTTWTVAEERLRREAGSLGELLERFRGRISPRLIGGAGWERLLRRARGLPVTLASDAFGFELPLHASGPGADLGVSVAAGTGSAHLFEARGRRDDGPPWGAGVAWLLDEAMREKSPLLNVVRNRIMLEYDIESARQDSPTAPGIFMYPIGRPVSRDRAELRDPALDVVLDAIDRSAGRKPDRGERRQVRRVNRARGPNTRFSSIGVFPSRGRGVRLAVSGFRGAREVTAFLDDVGWTGGRATLTSGMAYFLERSSLACMSIHLHVTASGVASRLGLGFSTRDRNRPSRHAPYWWNEPHDGSALLDGLRERGLCVPEKLSALAEWPSRPARLFGKSGEFVLLQGINHVKLVLTECRVEQVKAYVYLALITAR